MMDGIALALLYVVDANISTKRCGNLERAKPNLIFSALSKAADPLIHFQCAPGFHDLANPWLRWWRHAAVLGAHLCDST